MKRGLPTAPPVMTVTVLADGPDPAVGAAIAAMQDSLQHVPTEIIVASAMPWPEAPAGARVVATGRGSRGDILDQALEHARGELVAIVDAGTVLGDQWQASAIRVFKDPTVGAAGGPHLALAGAPLGQRASAALLSSVVGSGPLAYRYRRGHTRTVAELPTSNIVLRRDSLRAVGGFQSPTPMGEDARLCFKIRSILGQKVVYDPGLAVHFAPPPLIRPLLSEVSLWGRHRGDLSRRLAEISRPFPYLFLPIGLVCVLLLAASALVVPRGGLAVGMLAAFYALAVAIALVRLSDLGAGLLAALAAPLLHLTYAVGFWAGYLGRSLGETAPGRTRARPTRILVFNWRDVAHPWAGGAESYMHEVARRWVRDGCEVGWISSRYGGTSRLEVIDGIRIHRVGGHLTVYLRAALTYLRLRRRYDVLVDCENGIPFFTPLYSRKPVVLLVFHVHAEVFRTELSPRLRWLALWLEGRLMPWAYRGRPVVTISRSTVDDLRRGGWDPARLTVIKTGVDMPPQPPAERNPAPLLVCLGRLKRYKSVDVALRAMPAILEGFPDATLAVVGQGPDRARLERLAWELGLAGAVRFHGYLERSRRDQLLASAWVAVCPSAFEGFGITCLEANAWGLPVVASDVAGLRDAVRDQETGRLVPYGDPAMLATALQDLLADPARRESLGRQGRQWAAEHTWDASAAEFMDLLRALPAGGPYHVQAARGRRPRSSTR